MKTCHRLDILILGSLAVAVGVLSACSAPASTANTPSTSPATTPVASTQSTPTTATTRGQGASGTLVSMNGNTLTLTTAQGQVQVNAGSGAIIEKVISATLADLSPNQFLSITGNADSAGTIVATNIMVRPQGQNIPFPSTNDTFGGPGGRQFGTFNGTGQGGFSGNFTRPSFNGTAPTEFRRVYSGTLVQTTGGAVVINQTLPAQAQITINTTPDTVIQETVSASLAELSIGNFLTVFGNADANGVINAISITEGQSDQGFRFTPGGR